MYATRMDQRFESIIDCEATWEWDRTDSVAEKSIWQLLSHDTTPHLMQNLPSLSLFNSPSGARAASGQCCWQWGTGQHWWRQSRWKLSFEFYLYILCQWALFYLRPLSDKTGLPSRSCVQTHGARKKRHRILCDSVTYTYTTLLPKLNPLLTCDGRRKYYLLSGFKPVTYICVWLGALHCWNHHQPQHMSLGEIDAKHVVMQGIELWCHHAILLCDCIVWHFSKYYIFEYVYVYLFTFPLN